MIIHKLSCSGCNQEYQTGSLTNIFLEKAIKKENGLFGLPVYINGYCASVGYNIPQYIVYS